MVHPSLLLDDRAFVEGSTVRVLADEDGVVPADTIGRVIISSIAETLSLIEYEKGEQSGRAWLWNFELQLIDGSRKCH